MFYNIINGYLEKLLKYDDGSAHPALIFEAMRYCVLGDGKRMRPTLLLGVCDMLGGNIQYALPFAAAIELIHAYSLVHDDLPAMDNDDFRRGLPSCHKKYGEAIGILTGDALLNLAFEHMLESFEPDKSTIPKKYAKPDLSSRISACLDIATASGCRGMVGGQALEFASPARVLDSEGVLAVHRLKTGALISAAVLAGARLAGADSETMKIMRNLGEKFGMAFQILDDINDAPGDEVNFAATAGFDHARSLCAGLKDEIDVMLASLKYKNGFFHQYVNMILSGDL